MAARCSLPSLQPRVTIVTSALRCQNAVMERHSKPLPAPLLVISCILLVILGVNSFVRMLYWWNRNNPPFAALYGAGALIGAVFGLALIGLLIHAFSERSGVRSAFFDGESALVPTMVAFIFLGTGAYGLLVLADWEFGYDYLFYGALCLVGGLVLKRTFTMND
jgi:hypothetical protein